LLDVNDTLDATKLIVTSYTITNPLPDNHQYFWRVRAVNKNGDLSSWAIFSFRTAIIPPVLTAIDSPTLHSLRPSFNWSAPDGATSYTLQVSPNSNLSSPVLNVTVSTSPYTSTVDLPAGKLLYWQVRANGPNGPSLWSTSSSFTTPLPPGVPALLSPSNNALLTSTDAAPVYTPTLSWKPSSIPSGASAFDHYELQVSDKADFSNLLDTNDTLDATNLTGTSYPILNALPDNHTYYWRVRAYNTKQDISSWAVFTFRTAVGKPTLVAPANNPNASPSSQRPVFSWNGPLDASSYTIVVSTSSSLASPIINTNCTTPSYRPTTNLPSGKVLYWHVRANGTTGSGLWSDTWSFRAK
ncbi:MAG TPA: hypothetical protein VKF38_12370, partial [Anaerolineaceae bacterium]|nr:hypothetical protein [Anaerolineaceae bacterium]